MKRVVTLFSGYDSQCLALRRLGVDFDLVAWCEIDEDARKAHNALFPEFANRNIGDISKVDWDVFMKMRQGPAINYYDGHYLLFADEPTDSGDEHIDLLTYSSPCQDFSAVGRQAGGEEGSGTRSSLLWESERAIAALRPKYLLFENVGAVVSKKFKPLFESWCKRLEGYGYTNYWKILNARHYGVPQNRLRLYMVSIYGEHKPFKFPDPFPLQRKFSDVIEKHVHEKYFLSEAAIRSIFATPEGTNFRPTIDGGGEDYARALTCGDHSWRRTDNYITEDGRLRRLTEREAFRLMDVDDQDIDKLIASGIAKTQLAKMAGNSIVVNVLYCIFKNLITD